MKQTIKLTEADLRNMIKESICEALSESDVDEGFFNQLKTGAKTFFNNSDKGMSDRWNAAKKNYNTQGQIDQMDDAKRELQDVLNKINDLTDKGILSKNQTIADLEDVAYGRKPFGGSFNSKRANLQGQLYRRGLNKPNN